MMKASELIERLQRIVGESGDLPVYHVDDDAEGPIDVEVTEPGSALTYDSTHRELPKRITISSS